MGLAVWHCLDTSKIWIGNLGVTRFLFDLQYPMCDIDPALAVRDRALNQDALRAILTVDHEIIGIISGLAFAGIEINACVPMDAVCARIKNEMHR